MSGNVAWDDELTGPRFRVETQARESRNLLVLAGQIGVDRAAQLRDEAERLVASARDVDVDWQQAETMTAGPLQVLLALGVLLAERRKALHVIADHPNVPRQLELAGLSTRFPLPEPLA